MKSLFNEETYKEINNRLQKISKDSTKYWGEMNVAQMLHHCQKPILIALGKETVSPPHFLMKLAMKVMKPIMYNDKPWKKGLPTAKELTITSDKDFNSEKEKLASFIEEFYTHKNQEQWAPHPMFGSFTKEQWGKMQYKHLDHHFTQFGV